MTLKGLVVLIIAVILTLSLFPGCEEKIENEVSESSKAEPVQVSVAEQSKPKSGSIIIKFRNQSEEIPANNMEILFSNGIEMRPKQNAFEIKLPLFLLNEWHYESRFRDRVISCLSFPSGSRLLLWLLYPIALLITTII